MDRIGLLELISRTRELDPFERAEQIRLIRKQKINARRRTWRRERNHSAIERERYNNDPEYRRKRLDANERCRLRRLGRA